MKNKRQIKVVLDDGGGLALAVFADKYAHGYDNGGQLAEDLMALLDGDSCNNWDNNEWGTGVSNGDEFCRTYSGTPWQVIREILRDYHTDNIYGGNHVHLATQLAEL